MSGDPHVTSSGCTGSLPGHNFKIKTKRVTWNSRDSFFRRQNALSGLYGPSLHPQSALHRSRHHQLKHPLPSIPQHHSTPRLTIAALPLIPNPNRLPKKIISLPSQEAMLSLFPLPMPVPYHTLLKPYSPISSHHKNFFFSLRNIASIRAPHIPIPNLTPTLRNVRMSRPRCPAPQHNTTQTQRSAALLFSSSGKCGWAISRHLSPRPPRTALLICSSMPRRKWNRRAARLKL